MNKKKVREYCPRCESVGRKPSLNPKNEVIGLNGIKTKVCDECIEEIDAITNFLIEDEIKKDEEIN